MQKTYKTHRGVIESEKPCKSVTYFSFFIFHFSFSVSRFFKFFQIFQVGDVGLGTWTWDVGRGTWDVGPNTEYFRKRNQIRGPKVGIYPESDPTGINRKTGDE